jgi:hypothetical protein
VKYDRMWGGGWPVVVLAPLNSTVVIRGHRPPHIFLTIEPMRIFVFYISSYCVLFTCFFCMLVQNFVCAKYRVVGFEKVHSH